MRNKKDILRVLYYDDVFKALQAVFNVYIGTFEYGFDDLIEKVIEDVPMFARTDDHKENCCNELFELPICQDGAVDKVTLKKEIEKMYCPNAEADLAKAHKDGDWSETTFIGETTDVEAQATIIEKLVALMYVSNRIAKHAEKDSDKKSRDQYYNLKSNALEALLVSIYMYEKSFSDTYTYSYGIRKDESR